MLALSVDAGFSSVQREAIGCKISSTLVCAADAYDTLFCATGAGAEAGFSDVCCLAPLFPPNEKSKSSFRLETATAPKVSSFKASSSSRSLKSRVSGLSGPPGGAMGSNPKNDIVPAVLRVSFVLVASFHETQTQPATYRTQFQYIDEHSILHFPHHWARLLPNDTHGSFTE